MNCHEQFGFKSGHSTEFCIYTLQEYIEYYKRRNTTVFVTFLDASKAFERIGHWCLFAKLIDKHVPLFVSKLLVFGYSQQQMNIRWGNTVSSSFHVTNGVNQMVLYLQYCSMYIWMILAFLLITAVLMVIWVKKT